MNLVLKSKKNTHYATAHYDGEKIVILKGSRINKVESFSQMGDTVKNIRKDRNAVDEEGVLLKDIEFSSLSTAAMFVTGRSVNGYIAWRIDDKISLKEYRASQKNV